MEVGQEVKPDHLKEVIHTIANLKSGHDSYDHFRNRKPTSYSTEVDATKEFGRSNRTSGGSV